MAKSGPATRRSRSGGIVHPRAAPGDPLRPREQGRGTGLLRRHRPGLAARGRRADHRPRRRPEVNPLNRWRIPAARGRTPRPRCARTVRPSDPPASSSGSGTAARNRAAIRAKSSTRAPGSSALRRNSAWSASPASAGPMRCRSRAASAGWSRNVLYLPVAICARSGTGQPLGAHDHRVRREVAQPLRPRRDQTRHPAHEIKLRQRVHEAQQVADDDLPRVEPQSARVHDAQAQQPFARGLPAPERLERDAVDHRHDEEHHHRYRLRRVRRDEQQRGATRY